MCDELSHLYSYVLDEDISVAGMMQISHLGDALAVPIFVQAFNEYKHTSETLQNLNPVEPGLAVRSFAQEIDTYSASSFDKFIFARVDCDQGVK